MTNTRLYINNQLLLISKSIETLIDYAVNDIRTDNDNRASVSDLITIEATTDVRRVFNFPDYITSQDAIVLSKEYTAKIVDSNTILSGRVKFSRVRYKGNATYYEFYVIGDNGNWSAALSDKSLRDLDLWQYSHEWTQVNQEAAEIPNATKPYVYPLLSNSKLGIFYVHDIVLYTGNKPSFLIKGNIVLSDFTGQTLSFFGFGENSYNNETSSFTVEDNYTYQGEVMNRIIVNDFDFIGFDEAPFGYIEIKGGASRVRTTDRYPILRISDLLDRVFLGIGYKLQSSFNDNVLSKKYIVHEHFSGFDGQLRFQENFKFRTGIIEDKTVSNPSISTNEYKVAFDNTDYQINFDTLSQFNKTAFQYEPKVELNQSFYFALRFSITQSMQLQFFVVVEDLNGDKSYQNGVGLATYNTGTHEAETTLFSNLTIETTSKVYVVVRYFNSSGDITFLKGNCRFENRLNFTAKSEGDTLHLIQFLPDWSQLNFVSAIIKQFGLIVMTDLESRTIYIEDYDRFYDYNSIVDWSDKIDVSQEAELIDVPRSEAKATIYKYTHDDKDTALKYLKDTFNADYGSVEITNNSLFASDEKDEFVFNFAPTFMQTGPQIGLNETKLAKIDLEEFGEEHEVRILHYDGVKTLSNETWIQGNNTRSNIPHAYFYDDSNENYNSLACDDEPNTIGIITKHFAPFINERQNSKLFIPYLLLNTLDVSGFSSITDLKKDFRSLYLSKLRNEKVLFRLNKISQYNPNQLESTNCEFVKALPKRFLPSYNIPVFEFSNIQTIFTKPQQGQTTGTLTVSVEVQNTGNVPSNCIVYFTYRYTQIIASGLVYNNQSITLQVTFVVNPIVFNGGLTLPVDSFDGRVDWIYFGYNFVKRHHFIY